MTTNEKHGNDNKFSSRAMALRNSWINNRESTWNNVDCVVFPLGVVDENLVYKKSSAMHLYLSGSECENTVFLFTMNKMIIIAPNDRLKKLNPLYESVDSNVMSVESIGFDSSFSECNKKLNDILESESNIHSMGIIVKDKDNKLFETSPFINDFFKFCQDEKKYELKDVSDGTTDLLAVKDAFALNSIVKSCKVTCKWMTHCFITELEQILDQEKKISHSSFAIKIENSIKNPKSYKLNADPKYIDSCYTPIIESGGKYDLKPSAISNDDNLSPDTIICSMGAKYKDYCSNVSRTFFVDASKQEEEAYKILLKALDVAIKNMKTKNTLKDVSDAVINEINKSKSELLPNLMKSFGCGIGLQFRESGLTVTPKNTKELKKDMIFYVSVGLKELKVKNGKVSSILIGDTVQVEDNGGKRLTDVTRNWDDIYYTFHEDNNNDIFDANELLDLTANNTSGPNLRRRPEQSLEANRDKRREHQLQLIKQKQKENLKNRSDHVEEDDNDSFDDIKDLSSYKSSSEFPKDIRRNRIYVDKEKEVVFIPINALPVPFHIITIKNISKTEGEDHSLLRFNFHIPSSANMKGIDPIMAKACQMNPLASYIKTLNVKFYDTTHLDELVLKINECLKRIKQRIIDRENEADLVEQPNLILTKSVRPPLLRELNVRPSATRKANGIIEAHENGFRFKSQKGETIDILYTNIQHAIFQKCDKTNLLVILHFHLKHPIMIGKKKCGDVQFYSEAADATINVDGSRRSAYDADEVEEEQREIRFRKRLNATFKNFIEQAEKIADTHYHLEFEKPYSIGFTGVPDREMVYMQPTDSCLINITNTPFFVVTLSDVEHVHFERVISGTKEFDMCIIFKDHNRPVVRISSIAMDKLDMIETWLDNIDMTFTEGIANLNWKLTITAADDPLFWEDHDEDNNPKAIGWMGLDMTGGAGSESEGEESEDDEEYKSEEDEDEDDVDEEDDDMDEDAVDEEDEEEAEDEDESDEEEDGEDWDELDRKAAEEDRNALKRERNLNEADKFRQVKKRRR